MGMAFITEVFLNDVLLWVLAFFNLKITKHCSIRYGFRMSKYNHPFMLVYKEADLLKNAQQNYCY